MRADLTAELSPLLALEQLCDALGIQAAVVFEHRELGLFGERASEGAFSIEDAARLSRALRLARDLEMHAAAAVLMVELIEERDRLARRLDFLEKSLTRPL